MELTTQIVEDFLRLKAKVRKMTKLQKTMTDEIKEEMEFLKIEEYGPKDSQQVLYILKYEQFDPSFYEDMAKWAYRKLYGRRWKSVFEEHAEDGMRDVTALKNRTNPDYRRRR